MYLTVIGRCGPYPAKGAACSGYLIESDSGNTRIALEMGCGVLSRIADEAPALDAVILSHLHFDHMADMPVLGYMLDFSGRACLKVICPESPKDNLSYLRGKFDIYPPRDTMIGEIEVRFAKVLHPVETYAVKFICDNTTLVYTGDTNECAELALFSHGANTILADCGLSEKDWTPLKPHMSPGKCAELASKAKARELILTHISPRYNPEELLDEARAVFADSYLAEEGLRIRI